MDTPLTERANNVLEIAGREARALRHIYRGTEHLLLGLLAESEGLAARTLEHLGVTSDSVRASMQAKIGAAQYEPTGEISLTPRANKVLEHAAREAHSRDRDRVDTEHILLGLADENDGMAIRILEESGLDATKIRREVTRMLPPQPPSS